MSLCLVECLVGSVFLVLGSREPGPSVGQYRKRRSAVSLGLIDGGVGSSLGGNSGIQLGLGIDSSLLLISNCLLSSLHLALGDSQPLVGDSKLALALRLNGLRGRQRLGGSSHLCLGSLVLRARGTLLGTIEIGLGGVIARLRGIHILIGRDLCLLSCRKLALRIPLFNNGSIGSGLGVRELGLRVGRLLLCLLQLASRLLSGSLSCGNGLGSCVGRGGLRSLERGLGIGSRLLRSRQSIILVRQVLLSSVECSLRPFKCPHVRIGLVLRSTHLLLQLGRSGRGGSIARTARIIIGALRLLLVGSGSIIGRGSRLQIGLGSGGLGACGVDRRLQVGDLLRRRYNARTGTRRSSSRQRRHHRSRRTRGANAVRALRHRSQRRQQRAARHGDRRRGNRRHAPGDLRLTRSAAVAVLVHVLTHCRFLSTMS